MDDKNLVDDFNQGADPDPSQESDSFYSDDVEAEASAENNMDVDVKEDNDLEVTSGEMSIGDLDNDGMVGQGGEESYDEEAVPGGDNVTG